MGFNDLMHPRNIYRTSPPDFKILAEKYDYFRKIAKETKAGHSTVNFKDPEALRALTYALLENDFGLKLNIPLNRLIPTVPLRLNYILWIEDLLACLSDSQRHAVVRGFDIGSGASCIYPLLGAKLNNWHFLATEVDEVSASYAKENVKANGLESNITVKKVTQDSFLKVPLEGQDITEFDFCMCNPPFFISEFEASHGIARSEKRPQASGVCTGTETETVTGGGEVEFVKGIIKDSLALKEQISWYTTMLGKKSSLAPVLACLKENGIKTVTTTEFCQGHTMRWAVAWSFLPDIVVEDSPPKRRKRSKKAKPLHFVIPDKFAATRAGNDNQALKISDKVTAIGNYIKEILDELKVTVTEQEKTDKSRGIFALHCQAFDLTWAHQRRKRRENLRKGVPQENRSESDSMEGAGTEYMGDTSVDMETQEALKEEKTTGKNVAISANTDAETVTSSDTCSNELLDSQKCPSASVSHDFKQGESASSPLVSFMVRVGTGAEIAKDVSRDSVVLQMTWIDGQNKNDLYQLFQFFQNKILKDLKLVPNTQKN